MTPSGDMPTEIAQHESFSLANMIPQDPKNNQILWPLDGNNSIYDSFNLKIEE